MNLQSRASIITTTMDVMTYLSAEGNVVSLSSTLPSFTRPCDRQSGICSTPICMICITILLNLQCKSSHMLFCSYLNSPSLGWDPKGKKKELFHSKSRFILVHPTGDFSTLPLLAFSMFRFDNEEDEVVLYW
jgi:hypothetical protein